MDRWYSALGVEYRSGMEVGNNVVVVRKSSWRYHCYAMPARDEASKKVGKCSSRLQKVDRFEGWRWQVSSVQGRALDLRVNRDCRDRSQARRNNSSGRYRDRGLSCTTLPESLDSNLSIDSEMAFAIDAMRAFLYVST
ncbi:hypothetical protein DL98DRAFT_279953 [Cadophora sp. DSE1049]|nr:hypothetical protein DL98DRAFT_279953 [Cadophora sp. DSE1049]